MKWLAMAVIAWSMASTADAQTFDGYASLMADVLPNLRQGEEESRRAIELRSRAFAEYRRDIGSRIHLTASGFIEGVVRQRRDAPVIGAGIVRPQELSVEGRWPHADVRVGFSRVVWGRLDEFLPTDIVNPQDLTRFFLEGRSEGRMPIGLVRARWLPSERLTIEAIYVPVFRAGRFDQIDEESAPFNASPRPVCPGGPFPLVLSALSEVRRVEGSERQRVEGPCDRLELHRQEPAPTAGHAQGGVRASATSGRVDWSVSAYRGFEPLPLYQQRSVSTVPGPITITVDARFPRFTMIGGDFETVRGLWGLRGEIAAFVERSIQATAGADIVEGRAVEAGFGIDRKAGAYRMSGNIVMTRRTNSEAPGFSRGAPAIDRTDVTLVGSVDRSFARETRFIRAFAVYNPGEESAFARLIGSMSLRDNVSLEGSAGLFAGSGADVLARLADRDFLYARLKVFF